MPHAWTQFARCVTTEPGSRLTGPLDPFDLDRFVRAQADGVYERALVELRAGQKRSHWMWFVFPQVAGLGRSETARAYALTSLAEARAYLAHPVLGPRLRDCTAVLAALPAERSAQEVLGSTDALKLRSSMTLFWRADPGDPVFARVLARFWQGIPDDATDDLLGR